ncbi:MAG: ribosome maturation factor RimP [Propionibacteriaceae bacterium]|jgi:ribosome maturation factor RimP|nr:ribosome maturation factor RimP [Propionibacteriaceae bacterium]
MDKASLIELVTPIVSAINLEVDRVEIRPAGRRKLVQVFLDGDGPAGGGPDMDQIADATRAISKALDAANFGSGAYTLEVSSRGLNRPLVEPKHFRRNLGRLVELTEAGADASMYTGRIKEVDEAGVTLDVDGKPTHLDYAQIERAFVQVELS